MDCLTEDSRQTTLHVAGQTRIYATDAEVCHLGNIERRLLSDYAIYYRPADGYRITVEMLSEDVLLETFNFHVNEDMGKYLKPRRILVFQLPRRLNLRLLCRPRTRVRDALNIWTPLSLIIHSSTHEPPGLDNITVALERNDRVF